MGDLVKQTALQVEAPNANQAHAPNHLSSPEGRSNGPLVFLISPLVPYPPARGVELRIFRLLLWLRERGYRVVLILTAETLDPDVEILLRKMTHALHWTIAPFRTRLGLRYPALRRALWGTLKKMRNARPTEARPLADTHAHAAGNPGLKESFAPPRLIALVERLARKYRPNAAIVEYIFSIPALAVLPEGTLRIVDTIDVFSHKEEKVLAFGIGDPLVCSREEERRYLLQADLILAIQSREARLLEEVAPERVVVLTGMDFDVITDAKDATLRNSIVVVASDNPLNVHGLTAFLSECWPAIKAAEPTASLHIVGKVGNMCRVADPAIRYSGWVDDLDLTYREASVAINPTIAGTGLKIKSVQALAHGKPLVAWPNGVEGLDYHGDPPFVVCRSWMEFSHAVVRLLHSDAERFALAGRALDYARSEFAASKVYAELDRHLSASARQRVPLDQRNEKANDGRLSAAR
jgi:glycosyltransferase involved in cell wall biosynthesis